MDSWYCIVSLPADPVAELCVLDASDDADAVRKAHEIAACWPGAATLRVYRGERLVAALGEGLREAA